ncbi:hypothetical protein GGR56DRAFT_680984 [Xylariaceae sp. FL0804]|nr:hypothetical protein GGR56DRAFT_680984 [Xylariaceae sp. FL0804]
MAASDSSQPPPPPPLGFISIDVILHRPGGDPFNERTWPFPLIRERAEGTPEAAVVSAGGYDAAMLDRFVDAGRRLAARGAVGIITSCGFLAMAQSDLAARLPVPVLTSSLLQVPSLLALLGPAGGRVGILTYDAARLTRAHLERLGIPPARAPVRGAPHDGALRRHVRDGAEYVHADIRDELVAVARDMVREEGEGEGKGALRALCLECTNMPPFADDIHAAVGLPVYDIYTAGLWFYSGLVRQRPEGWGPVLKDNVTDRT